MALDLTTLTQNILRELRDTDERRARLVAALNALRQATRAVLATPSKKQRRPRVPHTVYAERVMAALQLFSEPVMPKQIMSKADVPYSQLFMVLNVLKKQGRVIHTDAGYAAALPVAMDALVADEQPAPESVN